MAKKETNAIDNSLDDVLKSIRKSYGDGAVMLLGEAPAMDIEVVSSGSMTLDHALGVGGYPKGRIIEIYGPESSGKTTLATHAVAEAQKENLKCAYIDVEHAFDREYASNLGVDVDKLIFSLPGCAEEALEIAYKLVSSGLIGMIIIDSVAALTPKAIIDGEMGDAKIGLLARLMSQSLSKLATIVSKTNCICIFINLLREKIGVMFGNPETTTGGNALKFYCSLRLEVRKVTTIKDGEESVANTVRVKVIKNKVAPPFKKAEFDIEFGKGIDKLSELVQIAINFDIIHKAGSWFSYDDAKLCQGLTNLKALLEDNEELYCEVYSKVKEKLSNKNTGLFDVDEILNQDNEL